MECKVSVYITVYNYSRYLKQAIDSVLNQTYKDWELIIVNDGSTDDTAKVLEEYKDNKKIKIIHQQNNNGLILSSKRAIEESSGEYIMRLDADDYLDENALLILATTLDSKPEIGLVYPDYYHVDEQGEVIEQVRRKKIDVEVELLDLPAHGAGTMIRKSCYNEIGGYNEKVVCQDGYDLWLKFIKRFEIYNVNLPLFYYRRHRHSLTKNEDLILKTRRYLKREFVKENFKDRKQGILGIIPVRAESSVYDRLAFKEIGGEPLIAYTIKEALKTTMLDKVVVVTEDEEIACLARRYNVDAILRPIELAKLNVPVEPSVLYTIERLKDEGYSPDIVVLLHINSPLRKAENIIEAIDTMLIYEVDSVVSVCEDLKYHYQHDYYGLRPLFEKRLLRLEKDSLYEENGAIFVSRVDVISRENFLGKRIGHVIMSREESIHIDSQFDFFIAEQVLLKRQKETCNT